jgi:ribosomal-protein-alanine N-acetyltransferase
MLAIRTLEPRDAKAMLDYFERNREHLKPWIPTLPIGFYTVDFHSYRLEQYVQSEKANEEFRFGVFDQSRLVANINLTAIEYGAFLNGRLGYSVDGDYAGQGIATEYVNYVCDFAFGNLHLHRLEANVMPRNVASRRVMEKCGFEIVGRSPQMVRIAGVWEDHDMFARVRD